MRKTTYSATAAILLGMATTLAVAISGCNQERATQSTQDGSWNVAPRVLAGDLTVNEMSQATWVRVEATRDGRVIAFVDSPFSARSAVLRVPDPGAVVVAVSGYEDKARTTMLWTGSTTVETGAANPTVPLARGPGLIPLPKPRFSADSGTFRNSFKLGIAADSAGLEIHYTTDGGDPTGNSPKYADSLVVDRSMIVSAVAFKKGRALSEVARANIKVKRDTVSPPKVSEGAGDYGRILQVALTCDTADAVIKYTTDGSEPGDSSATYTTPIPVAKSMKIRAFAKKAGLAPSGVRTFEYSINLPALSKPVFKTPGGRFDSAQDIAITADSGATIHYSTVQGVVPTEGDSIYRGPIRVATTTTISAIAVKSGKTRSPVATETYSIVPPGTTASPWFEPVGGVYKTAQTVRIKADSGAVVHCRLDGVDPDESSPVCGDPIRVETRTTIKAIAVMTGKRGSAVFPANYDIRPDTVAPVRMTPDGDDLYDAGQTVVLSSDTADAAIHYTLDGRIPTTSSPKYASPIVLDSTTTIRAIATKTGLVPSDVAIVNFVVRKQGALPEPVIAPSGVFGDSQRVSIRCDSAGASIHYTTDGSAPDAGSTKYTEPFQVKTTQQIRAIAIKRGSPNSPIASAWITIQVAGQAEAPRSSHAGGTYAGPQNVWLYTVTDTTLAIHYTTNDSTPTTASTRFDGNPIVVSKSMVVKAIAAKEGLVNSSVSTIRFTIEEKRLDTVAMPQIRPDGGSFTDKVLVGLSTATPGATIHYTLDGSEPTANSLVYEDSVPVGTSLVLKTMACQAGWVCSMTDTASFTVSIRPTVAKPTLDPPGGTFVGAQEIAVECATDSVDLRYTLDGSDPNTQSPKVGSSIKIESSAKLKVAAFREGWTSSAIAREEYAIIRKADKPGFTLVPSETLHVARNLALTSSVEGAVIHYTTDGSDPDSASSAFKDSIQVASSMLVKAVVLVPGMAPSDIAVAEYVYTQLGAVTAPSITPASTMFVDSLSISMTAVSGATIYYTTDSTDPKTSTTRRKYEGTFTIKASTTFKVYAEKSGMTDSPVRTFTYTLTSRVATPAISPKTDSYAGSQYATITCATAGAAIYYTTDGSAPSTASRLYTSSQPILVASTTTINAVAVATGMVSSAVATEKISILPQLALPTFSLASGTYKTILSVAIAPPVSGATIHYTMDGSVPTTASPKYVSALSVGATTSIRAIAVMTGYANSATATATYTIDLPKIDTLTFSTPSGYYTGSHTVYITAPVSGAAIHYTIDGTDPTTSSMECTSRGIYLTRNATIKAAAFKAGYKQSDVSTKVYYIRCPTIPTLTPDSTDKVAGNKSVTMKSVDAACPDIYYTINGQTPNSSTGKLYTGPVTVSYDQTIRAVAYGAGMYYSLQNVQGYNYVSRMLDVGAPAAVTFSAASGSYTLAQSVALASKGSTVIYYTLDWTEPTTASAKYVGPIKVTGTTTIKARAYNGLIAGPVSGANYLFGK